MEIGGLIAGDECDKLVVTGAASLAGTLDVSLINDYMPSNGDVFDVLDFASASGGFTTFNLPTLDGGLTWVTDQLIVDGRLCAGSCGGLSDGDFNASGLVDIGDLNLALFNWTTLGQDLPEEWTHMRPEMDVAVGTKELNFVLFNWNQTGSSSAAVPEPSATCLLLLAFVLYGLRRRS